MTAIKKNNITEPEDAENSIPLYQLIVKTLTAEIYRNVYPVGAPVPSESELISRFGVSRHTIRSAINELKMIGLVKPVQGKGTLVQEFGPSGYRHEISTIDDLFPKNAVTRNDPIDDKIYLLPSATDVFPLVEHNTDWIKITGDRTRPGAARPFNEFETYVAGRFKRLKRMVGPMSPSIYGVLETMYGETISQVEQIISGFVAKDGVGQRIGLKSGDAGIEVRRLHYLQSDGSVGIVSFNRYPISEYSFTMVLKRN